MVCRECGAYNAEHLTHCRVCAAKLRDDNTPSVSVGQNEEAKDTRPQRDFVKAPSWPTKPYSGAPEKSAFEKPAGRTSAGDEEYEDDLSMPWEDEAEAEAPIKPAPAPRPAAPAAAEKPYKAPAAASVAAKPKRVCSVCGRDMLADAPFCAYCGSHEGLPGAEGTVPAPAKRAAAAAPAKAVSKPAKKSAPVRDDDLDDFDDDLDDEYEDRAPAAKKAAKKHSVKKKDDFDFDDDDDDLDDDFDDDDDDDDFDDMPKKRGKGTTLLFWVLIVLLMALIGVFGAYIVKKNYGGDFNNLVAALTGKAPASTPAPGDEGVDAAPADASKMYTAEIGTDIDAATNTPVYVIDVYAPTNSVVRIKSTTELKNNGETTIPTNNHVILHVPQAAFLPNEPVESETIVIKPEITVTTPEGETVDIDVPEVTVQAEMLSITIESPAGGSIANTYDNKPVEIVGKVADYTVGVFVNGEQTTVYEDGTFKASYQPTGGEAAETVTVEARKNNCMTATSVITVEPFVMKEATLAVTNDVSVKGYELRAGTDNKTTIKGTTVPGATITATCANAKVTFETATVSDAGEFQLPVTVGEGGTFAVSLTATAEGYTEAKATCFVERLPNDSSSSYRKAAKSLKTEQHAAMVAGSVTSGDYVFTGTVTEVISSEPYEAVKMKLSSGEEVIVTNRSAKNRLDADDLNKKKTVAGSYVGLYEETGLPHLWIWYVWNV